LVDYPPAGAIIIELPMTEFAQAGRPLNPSRRADKRGSLLRGTGSG